jgi:hypothetical protein
MSLVQYTSSSDDEDKLDIKPKSNNNKTSIQINPAPLVKTEHLFSVLPSISSKEITRNLPLNELTKPVQGSL